MVKWLNDFNFLISPKMPIFHINLLRYHFPLSPKYLSCYPSQLQDQPHKLLMKHKNISAIHNKTFIIGTCYDKR